MIKTNIDKGILLLLCLFSISSLLLFQPVTNKILSVLISIVLIYSLTVGGKIKIKNLFVILLSILLIGFDLYTTHEILINVNDVVYLPLWVIFFLYLNERGEKFSVQIERDKQIIQYTINVWCVLLCFCILFNNNYFIVGRHRLASSAFMVVCLILTLKQKNNNNTTYLTLIFPITTILLSESRTYLGMLLIILIIAYYIHCKNKNNFYLTIIPIGLICTLFIRSTELGMRLFTIQQVGAFNNLDSWTSGRTNFWIADINSYLNASPFEQLFGQGYNAIYYVNQSVIALIYAHNDYINIIFANGLLGLSLYLILMFEYFIKYAKKYQPKWYIQGMVIVIIVLNAFFNGQYNYPAATFAIPFIYFCTNKSNKINSSIIFYSSKDNNEY